MNVNAMKGIGVLAAFLLALTGCLGGSSGQSENSILVHCASSTQNAVKEVADQFKKETGLEVQINSASSNTLATQILAGAPGSVFLSANQKWAEAVQRAEMVSDSTSLLNGRLVLITPKSSGIDRLNISEPEFWKNKTIAISGENVPAGIYANQVLKKLQILKSLKESGKLIPGQNTRHTLSVVEACEAELGFVYQTDAMISDKVRVLYVFDEKLHDPIQYQLLLLNNSTVESASQKFYDYLKGQEAAKIFLKHGFLTERQGSTEIPDIQKSKNGGRR